VADKKVSAFSAKTTVASTDLLHVVTPSVSNNKITVSDFRGYVDVRDYGAVGNGSTDDSAAFQAAHDALPADGGEIYVPPVATYYLLSSGLTFTKHVKLRGGGWYGSEILTTTADITLITTTARIQIVDLSVTFFGAAETDGTLLKITSSAANHGHSIIDSIFVAGGDTQFDIDLTNNLHVRNSQFLTYSTYCFDLENQSNPDAGDSFFSNNTFAGLAGSNGDIFVNTGGTSSINIANNKFLSSARHVSITPNNNNVGNYLFSNNSFEGHTEYGIYIVGSGTSVITKVLITGNQFSSNCTDHIHVGNGCKDVQITGNTFNGTAAANSNGINAASGCTNVNIAGNTFYQILSAISGTTDNVGMHISGNRFHDDITTIKLGNSSLGTEPSSEDITAGRYSANASDTVYDDILKVKLDGTLAVRAFGLVQGVGAATYARKVLVHDDDTITDIDAAVTDGAAFDVQLAASGGYLVVSVKRATSTGTSLSIWVECTARGRITDMQYT
jgi:polygalacturonase